MASGWYEGTNGRAWHSRDCMDAYPGPCVCGADGENACRAESEPAP